MTGTILNVLGILIGAGIGLVRRRPLSPANESFFQIMLAVFTVWYGLRLTWISFSGGFLQVLKQILILLLALILGKLLGQLLRLQQLSNHLGRGARERITEAAKPGAKPGFNDGFVACAALFCAAPLGLVGALQEGISGYFYPLAVKAVMDGLAAMGFVSLFGWSVMVAALPVLALQGTITLATAQYARPWLEAHNLIDPINLVGGMIVFSVALVILGLKRIELANYLPSLVIAPLMAWFF
jgi:uncharacterized membrane protein YqgA involved in biofilm formation